MSALAYNTQFISCAPNTVLTLPNIRIAGGTPSSPTSQLILVRGAYEARIYIDSDGNLNFTADGGAMGVDAAVSLHVFNNTPSTSAETGAIIVSGGAGILGDVYLGAGLHFDENDGDADMALDRFCTGLVMGTVTFPGGTAAVSIRYVRISTDIVMVTMNGFTALFNAPGVATLPAGTFPPHVAPTALTRNSGGHSMTIGSQGNDIYSYNIAIAPNGSATFTPQNTGSGDFPAGSNVALDTTFTFMRS